MKRTLHFAVAVTMSLAMTTVAHPQAEVTALAHGSEPVNRTGDLRISRFADFSEETIVAIGASLEVGDLLSSVSGATSVELDCGAETVLRFSGGFRALINDPEETDCALNFLSGTLDVLTDEPGEVDLGDVTLGTEGTQYSVVLTRSEEGPDRQVTVFDGKVRVRSEGVDARIETGKTWRLANKQATWGRVTEADAQKTAVRYARLDVAKSVAAGEQIADREKSTAELTVLHQAVLMKPADADSRVQLAKAQLQYKGDSAAAYNLKRVDVTSEEKLERYQIDKRVLPYLTQKAVPQPLAPTAPSGLVAVDPRRLTIVPDPYQLIDQGRNEEAIEILKRRAEEEPNAKVYCGLARAYRSLEGARSRQAAAFAARAIELGSSDGELSAKEIAACRRIQAGY